MGSPYCSQWPPITLKCCNHNIVLFYICGWVSIFLNSWYHILYKIRNNMRNKEVKSGDYGMGSSSCHIPRWRFLWHGLFRKFVTQSVSTMCLDTVLVKKTQDTSWNKLFTLISP
jgi:hypothetical protein